MAIPDLPTLKEQIRILSKIATEYAPATAVKALAAGRAISIPSPSSFVAHVPALESESAPELDQAKRIIGTLSSPPGERVYAPFWDAIPYYIDLEGLHPSLQWACTLEDQALRSLYQKRVSERGGDEWGVVVGWEELLIFGSDVGGLKAGKQGVKEGENAPESKGGGAKAWTLRPDEKAYHDFKMERVALQRELWESSGVAERCRSNEVEEEADQVQEAPCNAEEPTGKKRKAEEEEGAVEVPAVALGPIDLKTWRLQVDLARTAARKRLKMDTVEGAEGESLSTAVAETSMEDLGPESDSGGTWPQVRRFWDFKAELKEQIVALEEKYVKDMAAANKELAAKNQALIDKDNEIAAKNAALDAFTKAGYNDSTNETELDELRKRTAQLELEAKKEQVNRKRRERRWTKKNGLAMEKEQQAAAAKEEENRQLKSRIFALVQRNMELQSGLDDLTIRGNLAGATAREGDVRMDMSG